VFRIGVSCDQRRIGLAEELAERDLGIGVERREAPRAKVADDIGAESLPRKATLLVSMVLE
jgi:hypothetical protein